MAIPQIREILRSTLEVHEPGEGLRNEEVVARLAPVLSLTDEELRQRQSSGDEIFAQRVGWARSDLVKQGLLERPGLGQTRITAKGQAALASGNEIRRRTSDWAVKPVSRDSVLAAIAEFEAGDRDEVLQRHGYRRALDYVVVHNGREYDSKALYGIAYGLEYPDEEPIRNRGLSGGGTVVRRLRDLGFEIRSLRGEHSQPEELSTGARVWVVRAGREGRYEKLAIDEGVALIGWSDLGELHRSLTRDDLKQRIGETWGEHRPQSLASQAGQVLRFRDGIAEGDLVVLPLMSKPGHVGIARVVGSYEYRDDGLFADSDAKHTRPVT